MIKGVNVVNGLNGVNRAITKSFSQNAKRGLAAAMIASGAIALNAAHVGNPIKSDNQQNTELISKEGAKSLKANLIPQISQSTPHNTQVDNMLRKFIENDKDKEYIEKVIKSNYSNGTILGSALTQLEIDIQTLYAFMTANTKLMKTNNINPTLANKIESIGSDFFRTVTPNEKDVVNWLINTYAPTIRQHLQFDHKPTANEVSNKINNIVLTKSGLEFNDIRNYFADTKAFNSDVLNNKNDEQSLSTLVAYKMSIMNKLIFKAVLNKFHVIGIDDCMSDKMEKTFSDYFEDWMESTQPTGK